VLEKIASGAGAKLEGAAEQHVEKMKQDLETIKQKLEKSWL
jgi:predicted transcriptional regulator